MLEHFYGRHLADAASEAGAADRTPGYPRVLTPWRRPQRTADGYVCLLPYTTAHWRLFFENTGHPELARDPRFQDITARTRHIAELYELTGDPAYVRVLYRENGDSVEGLPFDLLGERADVMVGRGVPELTAWLTALQLGLLKKQEVDSKATAA